MANALSEEQWKQVLRLTEELVERPPHERQAVLDSAGAAPEIVREVLTLVDEFCALPGSLPIAGEWIGKSRLRQLGPRRDGLCTFCARHRIRPRGCT